MFDYLPQNETRIFSHISRKNSHSVMDKAQSIIEQYYSLMNYHPNDVWDIMDIHNCFVYANKNLNKIVGLNKHYDFEGRHMSEPPVACYDQCAAEFVEQNDFCVQQNKDVEVLDVHPGQDGDWFVYIFRKTPIVVNNEVIGTLHRGMDVMDHWKEGILGLQKILTFYTGKKEISTIIQSPLSLSDEQAEVLFFLLCRKRVKEIAQILNIAETAVRKRIDRLKENLGIHRAEDIVDAAIARNLHKHLPPRITGKQLSLIIN